MWIECDSYNISTLLVQALSHRLDYVEKIRLPSIDGRIQQAIEAPLSQVRKGFRVSGLGFRVAVSMPSEIIKVSTSSRVLPGGAQLFCESGFPHSSLMCLVLGCADIRLKWSILAPSRLNQLKFG